ncbi:MAG: Flp pilus assembly complex ATPase component TadA [Actinobacteria bacterium]|nr:Flp pilus assembly complex ATPase component TadA [Actinomycetota bacterium]
MTLSWSHPTVRPVVRAVVDGVRRQMGARFDRQVAEQLNRDQVAELIADEVRRLRTDDSGLLPATMTPDGRNAVWATALHAALAELVGLGRLQPLLDDDLTDAHINGCDQVWVVRADGSKHRADPVADSDADLLELGRTISRRYGQEGEQEWSETSPTAEVTLTSGHRVELVRDVTLRPSITIRRLDLSIFRVSQLVGLGTLHEAVADFLSAAVRYGCNLLVAGGTGAGKTVTTRCLINEIPPAERVITIEDVRELAVTDPRTVDRDGNRLHPDAVEILTRRPNAEGAGGFSLADGLRASKRMNPDRLIVGEVRSVEASDMIDAMLGEAGGSLCTVHAASARAALDRLVYLAANSSQLTESTARKMVADAVDLVVWQRRDPATGRRYVAEVIEIDGVDDGVLALHEAYRTDTAGRLVVADGPTLRLHQRLVEHGWITPVRQVG